MNLPWFITDWAVRSSVVILAGILLLWALRVRNACTRRAVLVVILCASLAIPVLMAVMPAVAFKAPVFTSQTGSPAPVPAFSASSGSAVHMVQQSGADTRRFDAWQLVFLVYAAVTGLLLLRLAMGLVLSIRLLRMSNSTGIKWNGISVRQSPDLSVPVTLGILCPTILLPENWRSWDSLKLRAVLAHEGSHVRHCDPLVQTVSVLHRALLWFSPLGWLLHRQIVAIAEQASDDAAIATVGDRAFYAQILLDFMRGPGLSRRCQAVAMGRRESPERRIRRILNGTTISLGIKPGSLFLIIFLVTPVTCIVAAARPTNPAPRAIVSAPMTPIAVRATSLLTSSLTTQAHANPVWAGAQSPMVTPVHTSSSARTSQTARASATPVRPYVIAHGKSTSGFPVSDDHRSVGDFRNRFGNPFTWVRQEEHNSVIPDSGALTEVDEAMESPNRVNRVQAGATEQQAKVNELQSNVSNLKSTVKTQQPMEQRQDRVNQIQNPISDGNNQALANQMQSEVKHEKAGVNAEQSKNPQETDTSKIETPSPAKLHHFHLGKLSFHPHQVRSPQFEPRLQPHGPKVEIRLQPHRPETELRLKPHRPQSELRLQPHPPETELRLKPHRPQTELWLKPHRPR